MPRAEHDVVYEPCLPDPHSPAQNNGPILNVRAPLCPRHALGQYVKSFRVVHLDIVEPEVHLLPELPSLLLDHAGRARNTIHLRRALLPCRFRGLQRSVERQGRVTALVG